MAVSVPAQDLKIFCRATWQACSFNLSDGWLMAECKGGSKEKL